MKLQDHLRAYASAMEDLHPSLNHIVLMRAAADRIDAMEDALEYIAGFEGPNRGQEADEMRRSAIAALTHDGGE